MILWIAPSFVGRSIDLQTKGHPSRNLGSGRWVVESLSHSVCLTEDKIGKTEVGICSSGTKGWGACRLAFPKNRWSPAFKQGRHHHISLIPWHAIYFSFIAPITLILSAITTRMSFSLALARFSACQLGLYFSVRPGCLSNFGICQAATKASTKSGKISVSRQFAKRTDTGTVQETHFVAVSSD